VTPGPVRRGARELAVLPLRLYRLVLSPLLPHACRFAPTCSAYAINAVLVHGVARGGALSARRLIRCHPYCAPGIDPVPAPR
jgi:putative membrane protein insertion efficiency factor